MTLGTDWEWMSQNPTGWLMSEKLDGVRAYWDGAALWTRSGKQIKAPAWFTAGLPSFHLDCELWAGRGQFQSASEGARYGRFTKAMKLMIFDCPQALGTWAQRMSNAPATSHASPVAWRMCEGDSDVRAAFEQVKSGDGEGLMLRCPQTVGYVVGRTTTLLKVKN